MLEWEPCPFCGGKIDTATDISAVQFPNGKWTETLHHKCANGTGIYMYSDQKEHEVIAYRTLMRAWNRRAENIKES